LISSSGDGTFDTAIPYTTSNRLIEYEGPLDVATGAAVTLGIPGIGGVSVTLGVLLPGDAGPGFVGFITGRIGSTCPAAIDIRPALSSTPEIADHD